MPKHHLSHLKANACIVRTDSENRGLYQEILTMAQLSSGPHFLSTPSDKLVLSGDATK